jgi:6,7-dimethyl-8-ribityllumazine synthase
MSTFGKELIQSMTEAVEHAEGKAGGVRVQVVEVPGAKSAPLTDHLMDLDRDFQAPGKVSA